MLANLKVEIATIDASNASIDRCVSRLGHNSGTGHDGSLFSRCASLSRRTLGRDAVAYLLRRRTARDER
jgi:hypothetical protein